MSIELDIMEYLTARMSEIFTLARSETHLVSHGPEGEVVAGDYPFLQVFGTTTAPTSGDLASQFGVLTFTLQLVDAQDPLNADAKRSEMRDAMETLSLELTRNPTMGGLVRSSSMTRVHFERSDEERVIAEAEVTAT